MATFSLTTGNDVVVAPASGSTVYATAATLNAGDSLTGGAATDVLELVGAGTFSLAQLASFTGFESVKLENPTNYSASLTLGNQPIEVDAIGLLNIQVNSLSNWNSSDVINGDASNSWPTTSLSFYNFASPYPPPPLTYDLTANTFSHVGTVSVGGNDVTLLINSGDAAGIQSFAAWGLNDQLVTADSTLDLSHTTVSGFRVASSNGVGTTFTVGDLGTAFQIDGGSGRDTLVVQGLTLTADQRTAIFKTSSIETITDQSGSYVSPLVSQGAPTAPVITTTAPAQDKASSIDIAGTAEAGSTVALSNNGNLVSTTTADAGGNWQVKGIALTDGFNYSFTAKAADAAGNTSGASSALAFHDDQTAPAVTERLVNDTGSLSSDKLTSNGALTGSGDPNALVHFTVDGNAIAATATADSAGAWTFTPTGLSDGSHTVIASETDAAGNAGTALLTFMLDTLAPVVTESLTSDTGSSSTDKITSKAALSGTGEPNAVVHFAVDGVAIDAPVIADGNGQWAFTPTGLADGQHTVIVSETDAAGNTGTATLTFKLDKTAPIDQITSDTVNKDKSLTIAGTSETGAVIKIFDGATQLGSTAADGNGHWTFTAKALSPTSVHSFTSTATDATGNVGQSTGAAIYGTASKDTLYSTSVTDILTGGSGADTFVFAKAGFGKDTITDFVATGAGHDILQFGHSVFSDVAAALAHATQAGNNVVIAYDAADTITLTGVKLNQLSANDFHFV